MNLVYAIRNAEGYYLNYRSLETNTRPIWEVALHIQCLIPSINVAKSLEYDWGGDLVRVELNEVN